MVPSFRSRPAVRPRAADLRAAAGFTLPEVMVTLAIFAIVIVAMLAIFDINGRIARVEGHVTDMQQSLRVAQSDMVRMVRMGARGGLPAALYAETGFTGRFLPTGVAIEVANNVPANTRIAGKELVLQGTDVITVRGVFTTTYLTNFNLEAVDESPKDGYPEKGTIVLPNETPTHVPQDLQTLADAIKASQEGNPEALLLVSLADDVFAVVEIAPSSSVTKVGGVITEVTIDFKAEGTTRSDLYAKLGKGGRFPKTTPLRLASIGILEEYRYYIRDPLPLNAANVPVLEPTLARARLYPGTDIPYDDEDKNLSEEIADNVLDLQVALGIDANRDSILTEGTDTASRKTDEWLFNESGDATTAATWNGTAKAQTKLYYVRLNTLVRTARRDPQTKWLAPALGSIEDKDYTLAPFNLFNTNTERRFRRQSLQTVVDLRNLS